MTTPKTEIYFATRKTASAHVYITKGNGKVRINNVPVEMIPQETAREVILAPLEITGDLRDKIDISVRVRGGGFMGQASAIATGISRALTGWTKSKKEPKDHPFPKSTREDLRKRITDFDKYLVSGDARRKEPKKFGGPGARRRKQKSYRQTVKAVILAGGKGTRGKPYTEYFPKAMTPIYGKPMIDYIVKYLKSFSFVDEVIIISDFNGLGGQIKNYYGNQKNITFVQDSQSGTGGDLLHIANKLKDESEFVLWFVDNLCAIDLKKMKEVFKEKKSSACIATRTKRKEETGFATVENGIIKEFKEKPVMKLQLSECLGVYILGKDIIKKIKAKQKQKKINLSFDILQGLSKEGKISAFDIGEKEWLDAESPMVLERNEKTVMKIIKQMGFQIVFQNLKFYLHIEK